MQVFVLAGTAGRNASGVLSGAPLTGLCSLALFAAGAVLLAVAAYYLRKAPESPLQ